MRIWDWSSDVFSSDLSDRWASRSYHNWARYQMSKLANLLFMFELDRRLSAAGRATQAIGCHPGVALTELQRHLPWPLRAMTPLASPFFNSAAQGAWPTLQAATGAHVQGGDYLGPQGLGEVTRSEEHTSEIQSLMRISYAVFCLKKKKQ